jgi:hypothetical protein
MGKYKPHGAGPLHLPELAMTAAMIATLGLGVTACASSTADYYPTCVDHNTGQVLPQDYCDRHPDLYWIYMSPRYYPYGGSPVFISHTTLVNAGPNAYFAGNDQSRRGAAGLPKTGSLPPSNTKITSSKGGFDGARGGKNGGGNGGNDGGTGHGNSGSGAGNGHGSAGG